MAKKEDKKDIEYKELCIISDDIQNRENIAFGFDAYANALAEMIATKYNKTPFTIGISGEWGSGKTTLMKEIEKKINTILAINKKHFRRIKTVWFNAWKYKDEEQILAALINEIITKIENDQSFINKIGDEGIKKIRKTWKSLNWTNVIKGMVQATGKIVLNVDMESLLEFNDDKKLVSEQYKEHLSFYDVFNKHFDKLLWEYLEVDKWEDRLKSLKKNSQAKVILPDQEAALVIFIDDLDRCPLPKIIQILETIKVFLDKKGCIFVLGAAKNIIRDALKNKPDYNNVDADKFLEKIIQIDFSLPRKTSDNSQKFIEEIKQQLNIKGKDIEKIIEIILPILDFNPRRIIALFNRIKLQESVFRHSNNTIVPFEKMIIWSAIEKYKGEFFSALSESEDNYFKIIKDIEIIKGSKQDKIAEQELLEKLQFDKLLNFYKDEKIQELLNSLSLNNNEKDKTVIKALISYSQTFQDEPEFENIDEYKEYLYKKEKEIENERIDYKKFIKIYGGEYDLENVGKKKIVPFAMAKYPVTNAWFQEFVDDGGYENKTYWEGEKAKDFLNNLEQKIPKYFNDDRFNKPYQPVVGVAWYEAQAFIAWLNEKENTTKYFLPDEEQWRAAAGGKEARKYPWGNEWDKTKCNNGELNMGRTTDVGIFSPKGDTNEGISDMAGNVWEWTKTNFGSHYVGRGGGWDGRAVHYRVADRDGNHPRIRDAYLGFRIAHSL